MSRGQLTIIGIFGLSLLAVIGGLAWRYHETRQVLDFWGADAATLIAQAEQVEAGRLEPVPGAYTGPGKFMMLIDDQFYGTLQTKDVSNAPGFTHARSALTLNRSFEWDHDDACSPSWMYALRFRQSEKSVTVLIDPHCRFVRLLDGKNVAVLNQIVADGLALVLNEQLASRETAAKSTTNILENRKGKPQ